jgi:hypothetical protein
MAHTLIASKTVDRMMVAEDELDALRKSIERDFMGSLNLNLLLLASNASNTSFPIY